MKKYHLKALPLMLLAMILSCQPPSPPGEEIPPAENIPITFDRLVLPAGYDVSLAEVVQRETPRPDRIPGGHRLVGTAFDITWDSREHTDFGESMAELHFTYNPNDFAGKGLVQDFQACYWDEEEERYQPAYATFTDPVNGTITVYTPHFTIFVLTALEPSTDNIMNAPGALGTAVVDANLGGILPADFMILGEGFEYYRDRDYHIRPWSSPAAPGYSADNARTFRELGFDGAVGLATYNGGQVAGYPLDQHKNFTGSDYIAFRTARNIDLYVAYDTRGGGSRAVFNQDADWLRSGFSVVTDGVTPYYIQTTDDVTWYSLYKRTYFAGEEVRLHGNRRGVTDTRISTNYWVIVKPAGCPPEDNGFNGLLPETGKPPAVETLTARMEGTAVVLEWLLPADTTLIDRIIVRRSLTSPPRTPYEGVAPAGLALGETGFRDTSVPAGTACYYSVFTVTTDDFPSNGVSAGILTGGTGIPLPVVTRVFPVTGSTGVNPGNSVAVVFSKPMDPATLEASSFYLKTGTTVVTGTVTYEAATRTAVFDPAGGLLPLTPYYVMVTTAARDADGNPLSALFTSVFRTSSASTGGIVDIGIINGILDPRPVLLTGMVDEFSVTDSVNCTASVTLPRGDEVYRWFVNGSPIHEGTDHLLSGLPAGNYRLDVLVYNGGVPTGGHTRLFTVVP